MSLDVVHERQKAHAYLDLLPPTQLRAVSSLLETMLDPIAQVLANAPLDDEPFTEEDQQAVAEADQWLSNNEPISLEAVLADFGLQLSDWEEMGKSPAPDVNGKRG
jgi:hypothetical protein